MRSRNGVTKWENVFKDDYELIGRDLFLPGRSETHECVFAIFFLRRPKHGYTGPFVQTYVPNSSGSFLHVICRRPAHSALQDSPRSLMVSDGMPKEDAYSQTAVIGTG